MQIQLFQKTCAVNQIEIDRVNKFAKQLIIQSKLKTWLFVPYVFRRYRYGDVTRISANPLCYNAVSLWTDMEGLRSHPIYSPQ